MGYAICFTKKEQAELVELVRPEQPEPGHVLGRTLYRLVSPGTELNTNYSRKRRNLSTLGMRQYLRLSR